MKGTPEGRQKAENDMVEWGEWYSRCTQIIIRAAEEDFSASDISSIMGISGGKVTRTLRNNGKGHLIRRRGDTTKARGMRHQK